MALKRGLFQTRILAVKAGDERAFEQAMREALPLIAATPGFLGIEVRTSIETRGRYLLLVRWGSLEAHTQTFRGSARYGEWKRRLHHFYDPFAIVEHYGDAIVTANATRYILCGRQFTVHRASGSRYSKRHKPQILFCEDPNDGIIHP